MMGSTNAMFVIGLGKAPGNVSDFSLYRRMFDLGLRWSDPPDDIWAGTKLVRKTGGYPTDENDGTVVIDNTNRNAYKDLILTDSGANSYTNVYYYQAFPYSKKGVYNRDPSNRVEGSPIGPY